MTGWGFLRRPKVGSSMMLKNCASSYMDAMIKSSRKNKKIIKSGSHAQG
ncbi:MAG: hypothetical protein HRU35_05815 [Rickettsiaceae bacterium]|nr:hypothetical protein [Rickettsiaceae bacterium]